MTKLQATSLILERSTIPQNAVSWGIPGIFEINNKKCGGENLDSYKSKANSAKENEWNLRKNVDQQQKNTNILAGAKEIYEKYKDKQLSPKAKNLLKILKDREVFLTQISSRTPYQDYIEKTKLAVSNNNVCGAYKAKENYDKNDFFYQDWENSRLKLKGALSDFLNEIKAPNPYATCGKETILTRTAFYRSEKQNNEKSIENAQRVYDTLSKQPMNAIDTALHKQLGEEIKKARASYAKNKQVVEAGIKQQNACLPKLADINSFRQSYTPLIGLLMNGRIDNVSLTSRHMEFNTILAGKKIRLSDVKTEYGFDLDLRHGDRYQKIISNAEAAAKSGKKSNITQDRIEKTEKLYQDLNRDFNDKSYSSDELRSRLYIYDTKDKDGRGGYVTIIPEKVRELDKRLKFFASELNKLEADLKK